VTSPGEASNNLPGESRTSRAPTSARLPAMLGPRPAASGWRGRCGRDCARLPRGGRELLGSCQLRLPGSEGLAVRGQPAPQHGSPGPAAVARAASCAGLAREQPGSAPFQLPQPPVQLLVNTCVFGQLLYWDLYKRRKQDVETLTLLYTRDAFMKPQH